MTAMSYSLPQQTYFSCSFLKCMMYRTTYIKTYINITVEASTVNILIYILLVHTSRVYPARLLDINVHKRTRWKCVLLTTILLLLTRACVCFLCGLTNSTPSRKIKYSRKMIWIIFCVKMLVHLQKQGLYSLRTTFKVA